MIFSLIILFFGSVIRWLIGYLPEATALPTDITQPIALIVSKAPYWETWFPFNMMFGMVKFVIITEIAIIGFNVGIWVYNKIRGSA